MGKSTIFMVFTRKDGDLSWAMLVPDTSIFAPEMSDKIWDSSAGEVALRPRTQRNLSEDLEKLESQNSPCWRLLIPAN